MWVLKYKPGSGPLQKGPIQITLWLCQVKRVWVWPPQVGPPLTITQLYKWSNPNNQVWTTSFEPDLLNPMNAKTKLCEFTVIKFAMVYYNHHARVFGIGEMWIHMVLTSYYTSRICYIQHDSISKPWDKEVHSKIGTWRGLMNQCCTII